MSDEVNDEVNTKLDVTLGIAMEYFSLTSNIEFNRFTSSDSASTSSYIYFV